MNCKQIVFMVLIMCTVMSAGLFGHDSNLTNYMTYFIFSFLCIYNTLIDLED